MVHVYSIVASRIIELDDERLCRIKLYYIGTPASKGRTCND